MSSSNSGVTSSASNASGTSSTSLMAGGMPAPQQTVTTSTHASISISGNIFITERFMSDPTWPADLQLDLEKSNWEEWSLQLSLSAGRLGFTKWLEGTLKQPDAITHPEAHDIWETNDRSLRAFILGCVSLSDYYAVSHLQESHSVFEGLRKLHEQRGIRAKANLLRKALDIRAPLDKPLSDTVDEITAIHTKIANMGTIDHDELRSLLLINALGDQFEHIRSAILSVADSPGFSSNSILRHLEREDMLIRFRAEQRAHAPTARVATSKDRQKLICSNCKREGHMADYCVRPRGKMAGKTIKEARNAQHAALGRPPCPTPYAANPQP